VNAKGMPLNLAHQDAILHVAIVPIQPDVNDAVLAHFLVIEEL
jgi:hypothetical protein